MSAQERKLVEATYDLNSGEVWVRSPHDASEWVTVERFQLLAEREVQPEQRCEYWTETRCSHWEKDKDGGGMHCVDEKTVKVCNCTD